MGERTSYEPGTFCWADLSTTDPDAAKAFYGPLLGWQVTDVPVGDGASYTMLAVDGRHVGALFGQNEEERSSGIPPHWNSYVSVADADQSAARASELGGNLLAPPFDVLTSGRMAVLTDPTGAAVCLWQPRDHVGAALVNDPGSMCWNELATTDLDAARDFYTGLFGWTYEEFPGDYNLIKNGGRNNGGIRRQSEMEAGIPPNWLVFFTTIDTLEADAQKLTQAGARVLVGPMEAGPGRFEAVADPQGAVFAIYEGEIEP